MRIRVPAVGWREQYDRLRRARAKLDTEHLSSLTYDDDFYHAAQDVWHLKDWIKNDEAQPEAVRSRISDAVHESKALLIIADIANGTKHLEITTPKAGAGISGTDSTIGGGTPMIRTIRVRMNDGTERTGVELLDEAINAWDLILETEGLL
jgi:hypothetical protein